MVFWMRRESRMIKGDLERKVDAAIRSANTRRAIVAVALVAVLREGIEAALFLIAAGTDESGGAVVAGHSRGSPWRRCWRTPSTGADGRCP
jgi:high-affinity iron transporter